MKVEFSEQDLRIPYPLPSPLLVARLSFPVKLWNMLVRFVTPVESLDALLRYIWATLGSLNPHIDLSSLRRQNPNPNNIRLSCLELPINLQIHFADILVHCQNMTCIPYYFFKEQLIQDLKDICFKVRSFAVTNHFLIVSSMIFSADYSQHLSIDTKAPNAPRSLIASLMTISYQAVRNSNTRTPLKALRALQNHQLHSCPWQISYKSIWVNLAQQEHPVIVIRHENKLKTSALWLRASQSHTLSFWVK